MPQLKRQTILFRKKHVNMDIITEYQMIWNIIYVVQTDVIYVQNSIRIVTDMNMEMYHMEKSVYIPFGN